MPAIFAQMRGDAVCPGRHRDARCRQRVRVGAATRVAHCGDMIDIHAET